MVNKTEKLSELVRRYPVVLLDTCALQDYLVDCLESNNFAVAPERLKRNKSSYDLWKEEFEKGEGFFVTQGIFEELSHGGMTKNGYKKKIKNSSRKANNLSNRNKEKERLNLEVMRAKDKSVKSRNSLIGMIVLKEGIVELSEGEQALYSYFYEGNKNLKSTYRIGENDYDMLITGAAMSMERGNTALITKDLPLMGAWKNFMKSFSAKEDVYNLFIRENFDGYVPANEFRRT